MINDLLCFFRRDGQQQAHLFENTETNKKKRPRTTQYTTIPKRKPEHLKGKGGKDKQKAERISWEAERFVEPVRALAQSKMWLGSPRQYTWLPSRANHDRCFFYQLSVLSLRIGAEIVPGATGLLSLIPPTVLNRLSYSSVAFA